MRHIALKVISILMVLRLFAILGILQGLLLSPNSTNVTFPRHHKLNAAVIQHLEDRIDQLEALVMCLIHNSFCQKLNDTSMYHHNLINAFQKGVSFI